MANWAQKLQVTSVLTMILWSVYFCTSIYTYCKFPCSNFTVRARCFTWAAANNTQYLLYYYKHKNTVGSSRLLAGKHAPFLLHIAGAIIFCNTCLAIFISSTVSATAPELDFEWDGDPSCLFDERSNLLITGYSGLDQIYNILFLWLFLSPLITSRRHERELADARPRSNLLKTLPAQPQPERTIPAKQASGGFLGVGDVIQANIAGAVCVAIAQGGVLLSVGFYREDMRIVSLGSCMNMVGLSTMFQDTMKIGRCMMTRSKSYSSQARRKYFATHSSVHPALDRNLTGITRQISVTGRNADIMRQLSAEKNNMSNMCFGSGQRQNMLRLAPTNK